MKGFVLAAGFGQRLLPITQTVPKPLLPVCNTPLIGLALRLLSYNGVREIAVNVHHLERQMRAALGDGEAFDVHLTYSHEKEILGTGGALKAMQRFLEDDTFVVINSDTVIDLDLHGAIATHKASGALATLIVRAEEPGMGHPEGQIDVDPVHHVRRILGQGPGGEALTSYMFAGVHIIEPRLLDFIPSQVASCIMRYAYQRALANHEHIHAIPATEYWRDAGTPASYLDANIDVLTRHARLAHHDPLAGYAHEPDRAVAQTVRMGRDIDIGPEAQLIPPVVIGDGVKIGAGAVVGPLAVLGAFATVGRRARVTESVVLPQARVAQGAVLHRGIKGRKGSIEVDGARETPNARQNELIAE